MELPDPRGRLLAEAEARGVSLTRLSRLVGRNDAWVQQYVRRGTPRRLPERERRMIADYLGIAETALGGPPDPTLVPAFDIAASAGPGGVVEVDLPDRPRRIDPAILERAGVRPADASIIRVAGDSMAPTLAHGDEILVDAGQRTPGSGGGIFVLRLDGVILVKRVRAVAQGLDVKSDNPHAPAIGVVARARVRVIGRVVWVSRSLI